MLSRLIALAGLAAIGYWFYTGMFAGSSVSREDMQWRENGDIMAKCLRREKSVSSLGGMAGVTPDGGDLEELCADQHGLYKEDGHWKSY